MSKVVLNSSVIIALSTLGYLNKLKHVFKEVLTPRAVYEEICVRGRGLIGDRELLEQCFCVVLMEIVSFRPNITLTFLKLSKMYSQCMPKLTVFTSSFSI